VPSRHIAPPHDFGRQRGIAEIDKPPSIAEGDVRDPKPKIGERKVARYLVGPSGGQIEDTRWWTFAFWPIEKLSPEKRL
ncbi:hypothetical protein, partial [Bradyrhizobium sp. USDA 3458]|uniref:hypothetical protein n=1 Tax=Bradyrhizobium sp. USDA 3458 TaxID=2591461 RepID=UPI001AEED140